MDISVFTKKINRKHQIGLSETRKKDQTATLSLFSI